MQHVHVFAFSALRGARVVRLRCTVVLSRDGSRVIRQVQRAEAERPLKRAGRWRETAGDGA